MTETIKATLTADGSQFLGEFKRAQDRMESFQKGMLIAGKTIAGALAVRAVISNVRRLADEIDELGKTATRLQLPVADVQVLSLAARQGGSNIDSLVASLNRAQLSATEAARGSERYAKEFRALRIEVAEFQRLDHSERLRVLADAYKNAADRGEAFASLTRIMGGNVSQLIPLLEGGSDALNELASQVRTLSDDGVRQIEKMNDQLALLGQNLKTELMAGLLAVKDPITGFVEQMTWAARALGVVMDAGNGIGLKGDLFDALDALRSIESMGGFGSGREDDTFKTLVSRFEAMNAEVKIQAQQMMATQAIMTQLDRGSITAEQAETQVGVLNQVADAARAALEAEQARKRELQEQATQIEAQAAMTEKLAAEEVKQAEALQKRIFGMKQLEEQMKILKREAEGLGSLTATPDELETIKSKIAETEDPEERLRMIRDMNRLLELREEIAGVQKEIDRNTAQAAQSTAREAERAATEKERELAAARDLARLKESQDKVRADVAAESRALELELAGRKDLADALREEVRMRAEAASLAERMGTSEETALNILRQQATIRKQLEGNTPSDTPRGRGSRTSPRFGSDAIRGARGLGRGPTLREAALDRAASDRAASQPPAQQFAKAEQILANQEDLQAQLLKHFKSMGTV